MPEPFFNKAAGFEPQNFPNFLRKHFLIEHLWWLLLTVRSFIFLFLFVCFDNQAGEQPDVLRAGQYFQIFRVQIVASSKW